MGGSITYRKLSQTINFICLRFIISTAIKNGTMAKNQRSYNVTPLDYDKSKLIQALTHPGVQKFALRLHSK